MKITDTIKSPGGIKPAVSPAKNMLDSEESNISELSSNRKAKFAQQKKYKPLVWFLSPNSKENAQWLATKDLDYSIKNGVQILVCLQLWLSGIRTARTFKYLFPVIMRGDPARREKLDTLKENAEKYFPELLSDCPKFKFKFTFSKHTTAKWVRMCKEHFSFLAEHLIVMTQEWAARFPNNRHKLESAAFWLTSEIDISSLPDLPQNESIIPDWRQIPPKYRSKNIYDGYKTYYSICMTENAQKAYADSGHQIPEFISTPRIAFD